MRAAATSSISSRSPVWIRRRRSAPCATSSGAPAPNYRGSSLPTSWCRIRARRRRPIEVALRMLEAGVDGVGIHLQADARRADQTLIESDYLGDVARAIFERVGNAAPVQVVGGLNVAQAKRLARAGLRAFVISGNLGQPDTVARYDLPAAQIERYVADFIAAVSSVALRPGRRPARGASKRCRSRIFIAFDSGPWGLTRGGKRISSRTPATIRSTVLGAFHPPERRCPVGSLHGCQRSGQMSPCRQPNSRIQSRTPPAGPAEFGTRVAWPRNLQLIKIPRRVSGGQEEWYEAFSGSGGTAPRWEHR